MVFRRGYMIYLAISLLGIIIANACLAVRSSAILETRSLRRLSFIHGVVLITYVLGSSFCVSTCLLFFGHTIYNPSSCKAAIVLSLVFYTGQKLSIHLFLVERTYSVHAKMRSRVTDYIYLAGLTFVIVGFFAVGVTMLVFHIDTFNSQTGVCQIGISKPVASILLGWDIFVNVFLTVVFVQRCKPYMVAGLREMFFPPVLRGFVKKFSLWRRIGTFEDQETVTIQQVALIKVIRKSFWACIGILVSTTANWSALIYWKGKETAWVFLTFFTLDVTWAILVIHWLTNSPQEMSSRAPSTSALITAPNPSARPSQPSIIHTQTMIAQHSSSDDTSQLGDRLRVHSIATRS